MSGVVTFHLLYALVTWTGKTFTFIPVRYSWRSLCVAVRVAIKKTDTLVLPVYVDDLLHGNAFWVFKINLSLIKLSAES
jgi:hypothetical protein